MNLRRSSAIALRQFYLIRGSFARLFPLFAWVAVDIVLWGFITKYLSSFMPGGSMLVPALLGAVLFWDFFMRVMQGVTIALFEDVWSRNFLNFFASPLTTSEYLAGLVTAGLLTSIIGLIVMIALATAVFGFSIFAYGIAAFPFIVVLLLFGVAIGIFGSGVVLRLGPASEWFIWPLPAVLSPFAGVFYPLDTLPLWMRAIGWLLPPSHVFESMRGIVAGRGIDWIALALAGALAVAYVLASVWFFSAMYRYGVRTGLIARYSAESIS